jgi:hypothetical protein
MAAKATAFLSYSTRRSCLRRTGSKRKAPSHVAAGGSAFTSTNELNQFE